MCGWADDLEISRGTDSQGSAEPGLLDYLRILWRHKLVIALTMVIAIGTVAALDQLRTRTYQGTAQILFTFQGTSGSASSADLTPADVATDIELIQSAPVQAVVAKTLHTAAPAVSATEVGTTNVAQITVRSTSPDFAAAAANAYARAYIQVTTQDFVTSQLATERQIQTQMTAVQDHINTINTTPGSATSAQDQAQLSGLYAELSSLQQQLSQIQVTTAQGASAGQLVSPAVPNAVPVSPKRVQDVVIAAGVGLLLGIGLALLRDYVDDRIRDADDLEEAAAGLPTIGLIPALSDWREQEDPIPRHCRTPPIPGGRGLPGAADVGQVHGPRAPREDPPGHEPGSHGGEDHHLGEPGLRHGRVRPASRPRGLRPAPPTGA